MGRIRPQEPGIHGIAHGGHRRHGETHVVVGATVRDMHLGDLDHAGCGAGRALRRVQVQEDAERGEGYEIAPSAVRDPERTVARSRVGRRLCGRGRGSGREAQDEHKTDPEGVAHVISMSARQPPS